MSAYIKVPLACLEGNGYKKLVECFGSGASHYLLNLWVNVAIHRPDGVLYGWNRDNIEEYCDWHGERGVLSDILLECDFIFFNTSSIYEVVNWKKHNKHLCDKREMSTLRARAAYICHYGKKEGIALFNAKYKGAEVPDEREVVDEYELTDQASLLLQKYERNTEKTNPKFKKDTISRLVYWLSIYTPEQINHAIDNYISECADIGIKQRYMRRSYDFFDGNENVHGFFEEYISAVACDKLKIYANDCFQSFQSSGGCNNCLKGVLNYCNYCVATNMTIHQTGVLANFYSKGDENASTRDERKTMGNSDLLGK